MGEENPEESERRVTKRPAFQFYWGDWLRKAKLRACSVAARGLWIDMLCYMHDLEPNGFFAINGRPIPDDRAANMFGVTVPVYRKLIEELEDHGVMSRTEGGVLYSRRIVRNGNAANVMANVTQLVEGEDEVEVTPRRGIPKGETPPGFLECWALYPKRPNNSRERALKAYDARIKAGADPAAILDGVKRYAAYCRREGTEGRYIKQAATFFGPDKHWESDYSSPTRKPAQPVVTYPKIQAPKVEGPAYVPVPEGERDPRLSPIIGSIGREMPKGAA